MLARPFLGKKSCLRIRKRSRINCLRTGRTRMLGTANYAYDRSHWCRRTIPHSLPCPHGQLVLLAPFACTNLRWGIGILPQQTGVYVPRCLNQVKRVGAGHLESLDQDPDLRRRRRPRRLGPKQEGRSVAWPACCRSPRRTACRYPVLRPCIAEANPGNLI